MKKNMKKRTVWIKARNKKVTKRRARFEKQIARAFLREDSKKRVAILYYSSGASRAFPRAEASNRRIHRLLVLLCCCVVVVVIIFLYFVR